MFKVAKLLNQNLYEKPEVEDSTEKSTINSNAVEYFKSKFQDVISQNIATFQGLPKALNEPITAEEVRKCVDRL